MKRTPWALRCPENHTNLSIGKDTFRCQSCQETYPKAQLEDLSK